NAGVITNNQGQFVLNEEDFIDANPRSLEMLVFRFLFDDKELFSIYNPQTPITSVPNVEVDANSDGAYRYLKEELFYRIGGGSDPNLSDNIKVKLKPIFNLVLDLQLKYANSLSFSNIQSSDFLVNRDQRFAGRGKAWFDQTSNLDSSDLLVSDFLEAKTRVESKLSQVNVISPIRKNAQLLFSLLDLGYFIVLSDSSILVMDRWNKLDSGELLKLKNYLNLDQVLTRVNLALPEDEKSILPSPQKIMNLSANELLVLSNMGPKQKLLVSEVVKDSRVFPWINLETISEFAKIVTASLLNRSQLYQESPLIHHNVLSSGEFVKNGEDNLLFYFPFENHQSLGFTKGVTAVIGARLNFRNSLSFQEQSFVEFLGKDELYLFYLENYLRKTHREALLNGFFPNVHRVPFFAPLSKLATQNLIYKNFSGDLQFSTQSIVNKVGFLKKFYQWNRDKILEGQSLNSNVKLEALDLFYELLFESLFVSANDTSKGLFISEGSNVIPNYLNISHLTKRISNTLLYYQKILSLSQINTVLSPDPAFLVWENKIEELSQFFENEFEIPDSDNKNSIRGRILNSYQLKTPLEDFKLLLLDSNQNLLHTTYSNAFGEFLFPEIQGPRDLLLNIEVNSLSNDAFQILTLSESLFIHGWETQKTLPDYYVLSTLRSSIASTVEVTQIAKGNQSPTLRLLSTKQLSKSLLELSIEYSDFES
ncbi:hypothetical protein MJH12_09945, partial [bacterium]|nr:hypothetical protein [bacterium]